MRPDDVTVAQRSIQLRKDGPEKMLRKRAPKGQVVTDVRELDANTKYRTPMSDDGHLWREGTRFFECGMWIEYPHYYEQGWDILLGPYWVQVDTRKGNDCHVCKSARPSKGNWEQDILAAAAKFNVEPKSPEEKESNMIPQTWTRWVSESKLRGRYAR